MSSQEREREGGGRGREKKLSLGRQNWQGMLDCEAMFCKRKQCLLSFGLKDESAVG